MQVVHLATFDRSGGAARSAYRLHQGLQQIGVDSLMHVREKASTDVAVHSWPLNLRGWRRKRVRWLEKWYVRKNRTPLSNTYFSLDRPLSVDERLIGAAAAADIIHLHWVSEFLRAESIQRLLQLGKPVVWTLHDQRPFTGGCHFTAGCLGFTSDCATCAQLRLDPFALPRRQLLGQIRSYGNGQIEVVTPSEWLANCARQSAVFRQSRIRVIPYGLDTNIFTPRSKIEARCALGLPSKGTLILFVADNAAEKRKGFDQLIEALKLCVAKAGMREKLKTGEIALVCVGHENEEVRALPFRAYPLGYLRSDAQMNDAYSAADLFLLPSLEDNSPNTALEAISAGIPVIAFAAGGIPEVIIDRENGRLVPVGDTVALAEALSEAVAHSEDLVKWGNNGRRRATEQHGQLIQARRYQEFYQSLLTTKVAEADIRERRSGGQNTATAT